MILLCQYVFYDADLDSGTDLKMFTFSINKINELEDYLALAEVWVSLSAFQIVYSNFTCEIKMVNCVQGEMLHKTRFLMCLRCRQWRPWQR